MGSHDHASPEFDNNEPRRGLGSIMSMGQSFSNNCQTQETEDSMILDTASRIEFPPVPSGMETDADLSTDVTEEFAPAAEQQPAETHTALESVKSESPVVMPMMQFTDVSEDPTPAQQQQPAAASADSQPDDRASSGIMCQDPAPILEKQADKLEKSTWSEPTISSSSMTGDEAMLSNEELVEKQKTLAFEDVGLFVMSSLGFPTSPPENPLVKSESSLASEDVEMSGTSTSHKKEVKDGEEDKKNGNIRGPKQSLHDVPVFSSDAEEEEQQQISPTPKVAPSRESISNTRYPLLKASKRQTSRSKVISTPKQTGKQNKASGPATANKNKVASGRVAKNKAPMKLKETGLKILQHITNQNMIPEQRVDDDSKEPAILAKSNKQKQFRELWNNCPKASDPSANRCDLAVLREAIKTLGARRINLDSSGKKWVLNKMNTGLFHYQVIGVAWMYQREISGGICPGGILADGMGLGKTLQMLYTMAANPPKKVPKSQRATLIIVPFATVMQWQREIERHAGEIFKDVIIYTGDDTKIKRYTLAKAHVVITHPAVVSKTCCYPDAVTINELGKESRARACANNISPEENDFQPVEEWVQENIDEAGFLHQIEWYRIVLDEAHCIKNYKSRQSMAINALKGRYKWALSGTPVQNSFKELYPYFRFWCHPKAQSLKMFRSHFLKPKNPDCTKRLNEEISKLVFGRTMNDRFLGRPLVDLPRAHEYCHTIELNPAEKILYDAVEQGFVDFLKRGKDKEDEGRTLKMVVVQLTRLRQMTAHPCLIEQAIKATTSPETLQEVHKKMQAQGSNEEKLIDRVEKWVEDKKNKRDEDTFEPLLEGQKSCGICHDIAMESPMVTPCGHVFCESCIDEVSHLQISGMGKETPSCDICHQPFDQSDVKPYKIKKQADKLDRSRSRATASPLKPIKTGKDSLKHVPSTIGYPWLDDYDEGKEILVPSTKMTALEDLVTKWKIEAPTDKIIIFTQWLPFATTIGRMLDRKKVGFVYFTGDMTMKQRDKAIAKFETDPQAGIMVATLKTASLGLNLTCANRVISLDPWWNECIERQAFGRVFRIGQEKETHFVRIIVKETVDSRILAMQEKKRESLGNLMHKKISPEELASLFGRDSTGRNRVQADYDLNDDLEDMECEGTGEPGVNDREMPDESESSSDSDSESDSDD